MVLRARCRMYVTSLPWAAAGLGVLACGERSYPLPSVPGGEYQLPHLVRVEQPASQEHFYIQGAKLYDRCGEQVVLRGVNKMSIWTDPRGNDFAEIAKTGANTVRIVWTVKDHLGEQALDAIIERAAQEKLIPIIELHDATGVLAQVADLVDFWVRPDIVSVLKRHRPYLIVNIANEAGGSGVPTHRFLEVYKDAIIRLRGAGLDMPLMIDAPQWGQNIDLLQSTASELLVADPQKNLLFSAHIWWPKGDKTNDPGSTARIKKELKESSEMGLPLVIGEFAHAGVGCSRSIDYKTIIAEAQHYQIGWLSWSWGPGNKDCAEMDMTADGSFESLKDWGLEVAVTDPNSIQKTSRIPASMFEGQCVERVLVTPSQSGR